MQFKEMRKKEKQMETSKALELLQRCSYGVLSTFGEDGYPYGVPICYVNINDSLYFHCALKGKKLDNIKNNEKVSFCVIGNTKLKANEFDMAYESVILFGRALEVFDEEKNNALEAIVNKYSKDYLSEGNEYIKKYSDKAKTFKIIIEDITGKISE